MDIKGSVKKYWPWAVGGLIVFWIMGRGGSAPNNNSGAGYAELMAAQAAAAQQNAQLAAIAAQQQAEKEIAMAQIGVQKDAIQAEREANALTAHNNYIMAQGAAAQGVGSAAGDLIASLSMPAIGAMNASATENSNTLAALAQVVVGGFNAQAGMVDSMSGVVPGIAEGMGSSNSGLFGALGQQETGNVTGNVISDVVKYGRYGPGFGRYPIMG